MLPGITQLSHIHHPRGRLLGGEGGEWAEGDVACVSCARGREALGMRSLRDAPTVTPR